MDKTFSIKQQKNNWRIYHNIWKIASGQGDDYRTDDCLLDYNYLMIIK